MSSLRTSPGCSKPWRYRPLQADSSIKLERPFVYIAETTSDLDDKVGEIRRDLKDRGYVVLPDGDLPYRADAYKDKVRECLKQAVLSVHIVGARYGFVPEGETKSNGWLQHDLAMERDADPNYIRLIWLPRDISASDQRQREFIAYLNDDAGIQGGVDLLNGNIEELKTVIYDRLAKLRKQQRVRGSRQRRGRGAKARARGTASRLHHVRRGGPKITFARCAAKISPGRGLRADASDPE